MEKDLWKPLTRVDRGCFACGFENPHGLQMSFETDGTQLRSKLNLRERFRGWGSLIHGGVLSTILDETMSWATIYLTGKFILTKGMQVNFVNPVRVGMELVSYGYILEKVSDRRVVTAAEIKGQRGELYASSKGEFALFTRAQFLKMRIVTEEDLELMSALIPD